MRPETHDGSGYVARRLGLKLAFLLVIAGVETALGWDSVVVQLACSLSGVVPCPCNLQQGAAHSG